jgi:aryl-alcohol dehydrogenase-like predicted oxidoreductase
MERRILGNTDLAVTALGYGAMELRHVGEREATRLLNAALDGDINYVDTSPDYGPSETYVGQAISRRRDEFYLATKYSFLIRFVLSHPGISTMIIGTRNPDHIAGNIKAATRGKLPDDVYKEAKRRLDAAGVVAEEL